MISFDSGLKFFADSWETISSPLFHPECLPVLRRWTPSAATQIKLLICRLVYLIRRLCILSTCMYFLFSVSDQYLIWYSNINHNPIISIDSDAFAQIPSILGIDLGSCGLSVINQTLFKNNQRLAYLFDASFLQINLISVLGSSTTTTWPSFLNHFLTISSL